VSLVLVDHTFNPSYYGGKDEENRHWKPAQAKVMRPYLENTQHKNRARGMVQVAESLPSKPEALSSNPSAAK
jgi:hypothetical protein